MGDDQHTIAVAGASVFYRRAPARDTEVLYLHSVPTSSDDWAGLLALTGGVAPDLPGFGRTSKAGNLDYSLPAYALFVEQFLDALDVRQVVLVGHGWGAAIGLLFAQRHPERVTRLAIIDAVPLLEGFQWPAMVRWWRRPGIGELLMGSVNRWWLARILRTGSVTPEAWPDARVDTVWDHFDQGTQRAILRLHRSVDAATLAASGADLGRLAQPALVVWGEQDPWLPASFAEAYAQRLPHATVERVAGAGHWPWLDVPALAERLAGFAA
ncbi:MAG TPA: alpha/beta hydrolase [Solirubrobacteraceae bacterium]|nr:alpha/beta hydrolase [Solirubrobacteraceae bacterium]